jgi:hypothetical protein
LWIDGEVLHDGLKVGHEGFKALGAIGGLEEVAALVGRDDGTEDPTWTCGGVCRQSRSRPWGADAVVGRWCCAGWSPRSGS